ncbi:MAG: ROK family protein [Ruminiclostridium sp.]|nr:ROK family protein [Ruminiclostridium sp.]
MKYYIGIDIGGTNLSTGVVDESYNIVGRSRIKTDNGRPYSEVIKDILESVRLAVSDAKIDMDDVKWIGTGCPGTCNPETGIVEYSNNLRWENVPLLSDIEKTFDKKTYIENDANAAAYGEYLAGAAKGAKNAVIITLGTGVGAGIILNGKIFSGTNYAGGEIGHTVIVMDGYQCTCGRRGCFETYASATGLARMTKEALEQHPDSKIAQLVEADGRISARTAFNAAKMMDEVGKAVVDRYIRALACGITNTINIFQPDILCIGGGVCNEGDRLLLPLKELVAKSVYSKNSKKNTEICICSLGNDAGIIGAAMLGKSGEGGLLRTAEAGITGIKSVLGIDKTRKDDQK